MHNKDVAHDPDWGLQLQKHDVVVIVQVSRAALVLSMGDKADDLPHLLSGLHASQGVLDQVNSVLLLQTVCCSEDQSGFGSGLPHRAATPVQAGLPSRAESERGR